MLLVLLLLLLVVLVVSMLTPGFLCSPTVFYQHPQGGRHPPRLVQLAHDALQMIRRLHPFLGCGLWHEGFATPQFVDGVHHRFFRCHKLADEVAHLP